MNEMPSSAGDGEDAIEQLAPPPSSATMTRAANHLFAGAFFERAFGRWPLPSDDPAATVNDLIFNRMIDPRWSPLERAFVDKETAKLQAKRLFPTLCVPETLLVIPMEDVLSTDHLYTLLQPFAGTNVIAKPTHASGATVLMRDVASSADLVLLYQAAMSDYAFSLREMQYWRLPRKIIVETIVPTCTGALPDDYKFHCVHGQALVYQVDHDRFGARWSRMFRVPGCQPMHDKDGLESPKTYVRAAPERIATMISAAQALAASFDYVRVDLYDGSDGVYFGEMTFTPAASVGVAPSSTGSRPDSPTHQLYSRIIMDTFARVPVAG